MLGLRNQPTEFDHLKYHGPVLSESVLAKVCGWCGQTQGHNKFFGLGLGLAHLTAPTINKPSINHLELRAHLLPTVGLILPLIVPKYLQTFALYASYNLQNLSVVIVYRLLALKQGCMYLIDMLSARRSTLLVIIPGMNCNKHVNMSINR